MGATGAIPPGGVAAAKSAAHAVVPSEAAQPWSALARVLSFAVSTACLLLRVASEPVVTSASNAALRKALANPAALVELAPTFAAAVMKGASAQAAAAVVSSLTTRVELPEASCEQLPTAAIRSRAELSVPPDRPGLPPLATR
jgi:hypothetical protein